MKDIHPANKVKISALIILLRSRVSGPTQNLFNNALN